jgi:hypothetical protein
MAFIVKAYLLFWVCCLWGFVEFLAVAEDGPNDDQEY